MSGEVRGDGRQAWLDLGAPKRSVLQLLPSLLTASPREMPERTPQSPGQGLTGHRWGMCGSGC